MSERYNDPEEAFAARTTRRGECLIWTGSVMSRGYGNMSVRGQNLLVHRYAWERANGPIPEGMEVDHRYHCDRLCVEVKHLRVTTHQKNLQNLSGPRSHNKSTGVRNVYPTGNKFYVKVAGKTYGTFDTVAEAQEVARETREKVFGEFAGNG